VSSSCSRLEACGSGVLDPQLFHRSSPPWNSRPPFFPVLSDPPAHPRSFCRLARLFFPLFSRVPGTIACSFSFAYTSFYFASWKLSTNRARFPFPKDVAISSRCRRFGTFLCTPFLSLFVAFSSPRRLGSRSASSPLFLPLFFCVSCEGWERSLPFSPSFGRGGCRVPLIGAFSVRSSRLPFGDSGFCRFSVPPSTTPFLLWRFHCLLFRQDTSEVSVIVFLLPFALSPFILHNV